MDTNIGLRIKYRRNELGLTQKQIKAKTGISSGNLSDLENGKKLPSTPALLSLSEILECSIDWLLKGWTNSNSLICENEMTLLENFRKLTPDNQEEIMEIISLKIARSKKPDPDAKSSHSQNQNDIAKMA